LRRWTSLGRRKDGYAKLRAYSCVSLQKITKPINNTGFGLNRKVWVYLLSPQNLLDFALDRKIKPKQKNFAMCGVESKRLFALVLFIAAPFMKSNKLHQKIKT